MILFFGNSKDTVFAVQVLQDLKAEDLKKLQWLFGNSPLVNGDIIKKTCIGPRASMITPWSTNAVEISSTSS